METTVFFTFWYLFNTLDGWHLHVRTWTGEDLAFVRTPGWSGMRVPERATDVAMAVELSQALSGASYCPMTAKDFYVRHRAAIEARNAADLARRCTQRAWAEAA
jgi:hypothetical protein